MFKKGQSGNPKGKAKGVLNDPRVASLKTLLENAFIRNQSVAIAKIDKMFQGEDMADFKFMLTLKASIEPRQIAHSGSIEFHAKTVLETVEEAEQRANNRLTVQSHN